MRRAGGRLPVRCLLAVAAVASFVGVHNAFIPTDWVDVTVRNVPAGVRLVYLIADDGGGGGARALHWYHSKVIPFTFDPREMSGDDWYWNVTGDQRRADVQWPRAGRYGVLARKKTGGWVLWWLGPGDLNGPPARRLVWGGSRAEITLPDESRASVPSEELLTQLGLPDQPPDPG